MDHRDILIDAARRPPPGRRARGLARSLASHPWRPVRGSPGYISGYRPRSRTVATVVMA
jgi:hypothetical protein